MDQDQATPANQEQEPHSAAAIGPSGASAAGAGPSGSSATDAGPAAAFAANAAGAPPKKKVSPTVAGLGFMVLFMAVYFVSQLITGAGPQVQWVRDFEEALKSSKSLNRRVFLLLHDPNCPVTSDMDRSVFPQRWARDILAQMVACRVELKENDPLRRKFKLTQSPTSIVLEPDGKPVREAHVGGYSEVQFRTYVHPK